MDMVDLGILATATFAGTQLLLCKLALTMDMVAPGSAANAGCAAVLSKWLLCRCLQPMDRVDVGILATAG